MSRITRERANALADKHGEGAAFAVYPPAQPVQRFDDLDEAEAYARPTGSYVLDWATGDYAQ